jgi:hypothetical protein
MPRRHPAQSPLKQRQAQKQANSGRAGIQKTTQRQARGPQAGVQKVVKAVEEKTLVAKSVAPKKQEEKHVVEV